MMTGWQVFHTVADLLLLIGVYVIGYVRGWHTGVAETEVRWSEAVGRADAERQYRTHCDGP